MRQFLLSFREDIVNMAFSVLHLLSPQQQRHGPLVDHEEEERGSGVQPSPGNAGCQHIQQQQSNCCVLADL